MNRASGDFIWQGGCVIEDLSGRRHPGETGVMRKVMIPGHGRAVATLLMAVMMTGLSRADDASRPNVVLIMADDLGWSDIGCYGGEIPTPHLDRLAAEGLRFRQFYNNAVCGPTRASLLTGLYCQQVGHAGHRWNDPKDLSKCALVPELLRDAGYRTAMVGKWQGRDLAVERGFDRFFGPQCQGKISYYDEVADNEFYLDGERWPEERRGEDFYMTDAFGERAAAFLEEMAGDRGRPFFLYLSWIAPHWPLHAPEEQIAPHRQRYLERGWRDWRIERVRHQRDSGLTPMGWKPSPRPASIPDWEDDPHRSWQAERMAVYAAQVAAIDRGIGRVLAVLEASGRADDTVVLFLSDNGAAPDGGLRPSTSGFGFSPENPRPDWRVDGVPVRPGSGPEVMPGPADTFAGYGPAWANLSNTPLRGQKSSAWEGGIRTPLIVRWPRVIGRERRGGFVDAVGHVIDFQPTFLELAGASYPREYGEKRHPLPLEGRSLVPLFRSADAWAERELYWSAPTNQAARAGRWKIVNAKIGGPWQLYDLEADATETTDLAAEHPERVAELAGRYDAWRLRVGAVTFGTPWRG